MGESERLHGGIPGESAATKSDALNGALQSLYRAYQKTFVYPPDPPAVPQALASALSGLEEALAGGSRLVIDVASRRLLIDGEPCSKDDDAVQSLAGLLQELNLEALEFSTGLTVRELESFIDELGRAKRNGCKGNGFVNMLQKADVERVRARAALDGRTAAFIEGLSPKLRRDLMRVDIQLAAESGAAQDDSTVGLAGDELLEALRDLDNMGARLPGQLLTLLTKLVRTSRPHSALTAGLHDKLAAWRVPAEALSAPSGSLRATLVEIFQRRSHANFIPPPHRDLLARLSRSKLEPTGFDLTDRYRDPRDMQDLKLQAAQVAARLVGGRGGERHRAGIFAFLALAADFLIERGQFDVVHDAAVSARTYSLLKTEPESTRRAARGFLDEFRGENRIRMILEHACTPEGLSQDAINLLSLGGVTALDQAVEFLGLRPPARVAQALVRFVAGRDVGQLEELLQTRLRRGWIALRPVLPILGTLPPLQGIPLLEALLEHEDRRVRRQAYAALIEFDRPFGSPAAYLRRALADESPRVVALALRQLSRMDGSDACELLGAYIECGLEGVIPRPGFARRAARSLLRSGEEGLSRLLRCLETLGRTPQRLHVTLARVVIDVLRDRRDDRQVARAVRRWKLSPAGLLSLTVRRANGSGAKGVS